MITKEQRDKLLKLISKEKAAEHRYMAFGDWSSEATDLASAEHDKASVELAQFIFSLTEK